VTLIAAGERQVLGQVTVEDLRRQYYESLTGDQAWWWIRAIYLDPNELIVDDDEGSLFRVEFDVSGDNITFAEPKEVKVKYVNASNGGIAAETINSGRTHVALFAERAESRPNEGDDDSSPQSDDVITIDLSATAAKPPEDVIQINLKEKR
jgi:hypothetical protein